MPEAPRLVVHCPECGAPLPIESANKPTTCPQCGATSVPAPAPAPQITVVVAQVARTAKGEDAATSSNCPRCKAPLFAGKAEDVELLGCGICGGVWLDNDGSTEITKRAHPRVVALADRARAHAKAPPAAAPREPIPCPMCDGAMKCVRAGGVADVDVCVAHGTWFDAGELARVADSYTRPQPQYVGYALPDFHAPQQHPFGAGDVVVGALELVSLLLK